LENRHLKSDQKHFRSINKIEIKIIAIKQSFTSALELLMGIAFIELSKRVVEALSFKQFVKRNYIIDYLFFVSFSWILLLPLLLTVLLTPCTSRLLYILLLDA